MASLTGYGHFSGVDLYKSTATIEGGIQIGQMAIDGKTGKIFRYAQAGATALVTGNLLQESVEDTSYINMAVTASTANDVVVNVTNGTATITAAQFKSGSLNVYTAGGIAIGDEYTILDIKGTLTTGGALKVTLDRPLRTSWTTSAKVVMKRSPWSGVIQFPATTQTGMAVGVAIFPIAATEYGWVQTHGVVSVLSDGSTFAVGSGIGTISGTAGAVTVATVGTTKQVVGVAREAAVSGKGINAFLQID